MGERIEHVIMLSLPSSMQHVDLLNVIVPEILKENNFTPDVQAQINNAAVEAGTKATENNPEGLEKQIDFQLTFTAEKQWVGIGVDAESEAPIPADAGRLIRLTLPSSMEYVYLLDIVVSEILRDTDFTEDVQEQINLAVIEAGTNAIKHGNKEDVTKRASLEFAITDAALTIVITDEGEGFTRQEVADPLDPENLLKSSGRGLFLMEACMDSVVYEANGTIVKMVKNLGDSEAE